MSWIKLDDQWLDHPKIMAAGRDARDMWLASITYCAKHLTDGYFHANLIPVFAVMAGVDVANCQTFAKTLLDVCLWEASGDMYHVHDYLEYNPSKEQANATKEARKAAGSAGGRAKASKNLANSQQNPAPSPYPSPYPNEELNESVNQSELASAFTRATNIMPGSNLQEWVEASQELTMAGVTAEEIPIAIEVMEKRNLTYSGLPSVVKTAIWVHSRRNANKPVFTGKNGESTETLADAFLNYKG